MKWRGPLGVRATRLLTTNVCDIALVQHIYLKINNEVRAHLHVRVKAVEAFN